MLEQLQDWFMGILLGDSMMMTVLVAPVVIALEYLWPARQAPVRHYLFGIRYWLANLLLLSLVSPALNAFVARAVQSIGFGLIDLRVIGIGGIGGALLALLVSTFILDFFYYWFHRTLHANRVLWQTHLLHHSDEHMNAMTAQRGHVLEGLVAPLFITLPMAVLFNMPPVTIGYLAVLPYAYQFFAHANIRVGFGPFWWVIISPEYHRIHHSIELRHRDRNFVNWFPFWDWLFGTLYLPQKDEYPATGVEGVVVANLRDAFALPFRGWFDMARRGSGPASKAADNVDRPRA